MANDTREFDIVIFGATGHTGMYAIEELANSTKATKIKWAVAARNMEKLLTTLQQVQKYLPDVYILNVPMIKADISDQKSILEMCKRTKVILNCVGPYKLYGEAVVSACIEARTHQVDISGEFDYLEHIQAKYFKVAAEKGVYIIQACGFEGIPADYGISLMKKNFSGDLNSVKYYVEWNKERFDFKTGAATFLSLVCSNARFFKMPYYSKLVKQEVFKKDLPENKYSLSWKLVFYSKVVNGCCIRFLLPGERVIKRSQLFQYAFLNQRPVESRCYGKLPFFILLYMSIFMGISGFLSYFSWGRALLSKYPEIFTCGFFSKDGPTREQVNQCNAKFTLIGEGWKYKLADPTEQHIVKPDTKLKLTITGPEPAYPFTTKCMVHAGLVVLEEMDKMPLQGGVLTPGVAFEHTTLSRRLEVAGIVFTLEEIF